MTAKLLERDGLATVTSLHLTFKIRRFIILLQTKKKQLLWTMAAAQAAENHGDE